MDIHPGSVLIGSIITNLNRPDKRLSTFTPVLHEWADTAEPAKGHGFHTGNETADITLQADTPLFKTTAKNAVGELPSVGPNSFHISFSASEITTRRFVPSAKYVRAAVADREVAKLFELGGSAARAYLVVGVKVAREVSVVCGDSEDRGTRVRTRACYQRAKYPGPVVFGVEVEELRLARDGGIVRKDLDT